MIRSNFIYAISAAPYYKPVVSVCFNKSGKEKYFIYFKMENMFESFMYCNVLVLFLIPKKEQMEWLLKEQFDQ